MRILYLTHDLSDPASHKRVRMLRAGGAKVTVAGFSREKDNLTLDGVSAISFGRTYNARFIQRIGAVLRTMVTVRRHRDLFANTDLILARNLEMLAIGVRGRKLCPTPPALVYESLDIHRLLLREDAIGTGLRRLEGRLSRAASLLITSSPAFVSEYFEKRSQVRLPIYLLENKVFPAPENRSIAQRPPGPPWRIGWFGAIRCRKSLDSLCAVARAHPGLIEVIIRGRPAYDQFDNFEAQVNATPGTSFLGTYDNPRDLAQIYGDVHFSWAIDRFEEGLNSAWLLPNRLYEGGLYNAVPLALEGVATADYIARKQLGHALALPLENSLASFLKQLTPEHYYNLQAAANAIPRTDWICSVEECQQLVTQLASLTAPAKKLQPISVNNKPALVVIPCLNEEKYIGELISYLVEESRTCPMHIVVADGGSTDGTVEIIQRLATQHSNVTYLHNPKRIQSAAINLAAQTYGNQAEFLVRLDAHASYPPDFCATLLAEAARTGADSVVTSIYTVGKQGFQKAVAAAQNSKLGNGGSAHRSNMQEGRWVEHGHHSLMRVSAYRAVNGYDESFSHNEDAELDVRLRRAGYRIWLTAATIVEYYPRSTALSLFRQYRNYGCGRVRTLLKHGEKPKLRQLMPVAVLPAAILLLASPFWWLAALPFAAWAGVCLAYGSALAVNNQQPRLMLSGPAAMLMHGGWSVGFWQGLLRHVTGRSR